MIIPNKGTPVFFFGVGWKWSSQITEPESIGPEAPTMSVTISPERPARCQSSIRNYTTAQPVVFAFIQFSAGFRNEHSKIHHVERSGVSGVRVKRLRWPMLS
jgi:hypothetical protein